jgi:hypothetical protein
LRPTAKCDESWLKEVYCEEVGDVDISERRERGKDGRWRVIWFEGVGYERTGDDESDILWMGNLHTAGLG